MALETFQSAWLGITAARRRVPCQLAWGDGLLDQGLSSLWRSCSWAEVDLDELVFLIPSLAGCREPGSGGCVSILRDALGRQEKIALECLAQIATPDQCEQIFDLAFAADVFSPSHARSGWLTVLPGRAVRDARLINALTAMPYLSRMLKDATRLGAGLQNSAQPVPELCDVLASSIQSRINAAYVYPTYESCHELLSTGAWLGHLVHGRPAYMPGFVADCLADYCPSRSSTSGQAADPCAAILWTYADVCIGASKLLSIAERVRADGVPRIVRPRLRTGAGYRDRILGDPFYSYFNVKVPTGFNAGFM
jgi:hypothetical protein